MSVYEGHGVTLHHADCLDVLRSLPDCSVDSVVCDPPYNLSFMAKPWDAYEGREDAGFAYWLSGLIDGEGHFAIKAHSRGTHAPYFQLKMRADERGTLDRIRRLLGVGVVSIESKEPNPMAKYVIQDKAGCQRLVDLLDKYPLRAKKQLDYWTWREAVCEWTSRPRGNRWHGAVDNAHMAELRSRLMENRAYTDVPWSGHEFQDWCRLWATECLRVLKPGAHLLAFGGTRTWHRLACAVEDAGFEVRDSIAWLYGSGFPKSLDVSKAIDKRPGVGQHPEFALHLAERREAAGLSRADVSERVVGTRTGACWNWEHHQFPEAKWWPALRDLLDLDDAKWGPVIAEAERQKIGTRTAGRLAVAPGQGADRSAVDLDITTHATPDAERWQGWGTALKPAFEPVVVARKPLASPGVNVLSVVESELRERGVEGAIQWTNGPVSGAVRLDPLTSSSSTGAPPAGEISAAPAAASETPSDARPTDRSSATNMPNGATPTASTSAPTPSAGPLSCETRCSTPTAESAPAATSASGCSSPSTTSTEAAPSTARRRGARSTTRSSGSGSLTVTESFAGIATGLSGSWATVRIDRLEDGTCVWPDGLPRSTAGGQTVAANVLAWGTGALNIDGCRVEGEFTSGWSKSGSKASENDSMSGPNYARDPKPDNPAGRWPANVVLDESQAEALDEQSGTQRDGTAVNRNKDPKAEKPHEVYGGGWLNGDRPDITYGGQGGASRFFYVAKADASERPRVNGTAHPTVKPLDLMRWLVRLVTPPGGTVLEPFAGSGTTVEACIIEGFQCIAIEREADYLPLIRQRIDRRRDPVEALRGQAADLGLFDLLGGEGA